MVPLCLYTYHGPGKDKPSLEGWEEKCIQVMDTTHTGSSNNMQEPKNIQTLCKQWFTKYADIVNSVPLELLPLRAVNHCIPLISDNKQY